MGDFECCGERRSSFACGSGWCCEQAFGGVLRAESGADAFANESVAGLFLFAEAFDDGVLPIERGVDLDHARRVAGDYNLWMRHANLPHHLYVNVKNEFLGPGMPPGVTPGIWHAVYCRPGQYLYCHVLLASGAHWSGLPLHALSTTEAFDCDLDGRLQPWSAMGEEIEAVMLDYLDGLRVDAFKAQTLGRHTGIVIDWADGFSRYPAEHKPLSLLVADAGYFLLLPNNYFTVSDSHFMQSKYAEQKRLYKRGDVEYWGE